MRPGPAITKSRARTLLFIWSAPALALVLAVAVSTLCCVTPLHGFIHQERGMQACNHDAQQIDAQDAGDSPFSRPASSAPMRGDLEASPAITRSALHIHGDATRLAELRFFDTGPPAPDEPTQSRLALFRI